MDSPVKPGNDSSHHPFTLSSSKGIPTPFALSSSKGIPTPFALSLSKGIPGFDKLSPNGRRAQPERKMISARTEWAFSTPAP